MSLVTRALDWVLGYLSRFDDDREKERLHMDTYGPIRALDVLRDALSGDKRPIAFFLGAGCPCSIRVDTADGNKAPLIPGVSGLTNEVHLAMSANGHTAYTKVLKTLSMAPEQPSFNIETILSKVRLLLQLCDGNSLMGLHSDELVKIERTLCSEIERVVDKRLPSRESPYHKLIGWVGSIERSNPVEIFTPNYDLLLEQAFEDEGLPYFDGFVGARRPFFDVAAVEGVEGPSRWTRLWKIHGSIDWTLNENGQIFRERTEGPMLVHPSHLKYEESRRMPYMALMDRLRRFLRLQQAVVVFSGYSFRDEHINDIIVQGLRANGQCAAYALCYGTLQRNTHLSAIARQRHNLTVLARDGCIVGGCEYRWEQVDRSGVTGLPIKLEESDSTGMVECESTIGDFAEFSEFLYSMTGEGHDD